MKPLSKQISGKHVLIRVDYNVPLNEGKVVNNERLKVSLPTLNFLMENECKIIIASHLGRPKGKPVPEMSLKPVAEELSKLLGKEVVFVEDCVGIELPEMQAGDIVMLENTRFHPEEKTNDAGFSQQLASLAEAFVFEGFAVAHRKNASTVGVQAYLPSYMGFHVEKELKAIDKILKQPKHPFVVVLGGAKLSDKLQIINFMSDKADSILIGGAMAFPIMIFKGHKVGDSFVEEGSVDLVQDLDLSKVLLPEDFFVGESKQAQEAKAVDKQAIPENSMALDIGPKSVEKFARVLAAANTIIWNGPMGVFENPSFSTGTLAIALASAQPSKLTLIGGGDTLAAIQKLAPQARFTHVSVGGGALLTLLAGKPLPALDN